MAWRQVHDTQVCEKLCACCLCVNAHPVYVSAYIVYIGSSYKNCGPG
jgi:hypothetical protein